MPNRFSPVRSSSAEGLSERLKRLRPGGKDAGHRLWRTTTFRLTTLFGLVFAGAILLLLGLVYLQTAGYLTRRVDHALAREVDVFARAGPESVLRRFKQEAARDPLNSFGLFTSAGVQVAGDTRLKPTDLVHDSVPQNVDGGRGLLPARALKADLPWGETLIVERDTRQLVELRQIILGALVWSGVGIVILGLVCGIALSIRPLRRVQAFQDASEAITAGDVSRRLPVDGSRDELDELAHIVNAMMDEIERLVLQARTVGESVAHELRTPLTRLRATLDHARQAFDAPGDLRGRLLDRCVSETESVMARFQALLRIAAVEARSRREGVGPTSLNAIVDLIAELYQPLAAERAITFEAAAESEVVVQGDADLLTEAVSNLVDNALKFTPSGGAVRLRLSATAEGPVISVRDNGPGIEADERPLVTKRFYRSARSAHVAGHGLGLSLVAAVADLHGLELRIEDAAPGTVISLVGGNA